MNEVVTDEELFIPVSELVIRKYISAGSKQHEIYWFCASKYFVITNKIVEPGLHHLIIQGASH
jgi:hypothetical protein